MSQEDTREFIGGLSITVVKGTNLAVRDMLTSDPYVVLALGAQVYLYYFYIHNHLFLLLLNLALKQSTTAPNFRKLKRRLKRVILIQYGMRCLRYLYLEIMDL